MRRRYQQSALRFQPVNVITLVRVQPKRGILRVRLQLREFKEIRFK